MQQPAQEMLYVNQRWSAIKKIIYILENSKVNPQEMYSLNTGKASCAKHGTECYIHAKQTFISDKNLAGNLTLPGTIKKIIFNLKTKQT